MGRPGRPEPSRRFLRPAAVYVRGSDGVRAARGLTRPPAETFPDPFDRPRRYYRRWAYPRANPYYRPRAGPLTSRTRRPVMVCFRTAPIAAGLFGLLVLV